MSRRTRAWEVAIGEELECVCERCRSVRGGRRSIEGQHYHWPLTQDVSTHLLVVLEKKCCDTVSFPPAKITRYTLYMYLHVAAIRTLTTIAKSISVWRTYKC